MPVFDLLGVWTEKIGNNDVIVIVIRCFVWMNSNAMPVRDVHWHANEQRTYHIWTTLCVFFFIYFVSFATSEHEQFRWWRWLIVFLSAVSFAKIFESIRTSSIVAWLKMVLSTHNCYGIGWFVFFLYIVIMGKFSVAVPISVLMVYYFTGKRRKATASEKCVERILVA